MYIDHEFKGALLLVIYGQRVKALLIKNVFISHIYIYIYNKQCIVV